MIYASIINSVQTKFQPGWEYFKHHNYADQIEYELDKELSPDTKYILPMFYCHETLYDQQKWIDETNSFLMFYKEFINQKNVYPIVVDILEANANIKQNVSQLKCDKRFDLITADRNNSTWNLENINCHFANFWGYKMPAHEYPIEYIPNRVYINLNNVARYHRCELLQQLIDADLLKKGWNTFGDKFDNYKWYAIDKPNNSIHKTKFDVLDIDNLKNANPNGVVPVDHCKQSFIYIATETLIDNDRMFFSEKVYKPISIGMPFMVLGNCGTLAVLKEEGYRTFDEWIDESYDLNLPIDERISIIIKNIQMLDKLDLQKLRKEMMPNIRHNQNVYRSYHQQPNNVRKRIEEVCQQRLL